MLDNENLSGDPNWERKTLEKIALASIKEQRRHRRWGIFFKLIFFSYLFTVLWLFWPEDSAISQPGKGRDHTALIDVRGVIDETGAANAEDIISSLHEAFKDKNTEGIILRINSPGGSPVQAATIYREIRYLRQRYKRTKIYTVCVDLCTSAAYYVATATDGIYADQASLVGSIGVLLDGFGFVDTMKKVGAERRMLTSGDRKGFLDPFSPSKPDDIKYAQGLIDNVHQQFIKDVKQGRGNRLKNNPELFSGLVWTGEQALPLGLIDGIGTVNSVAREVIKNKTIVDYTQRPGLLQQFSDRLSASFSKELSKEMGFTPKGFR